jgi:hypothetical protein
MPIPSRSRQTAHRRRGRGRAQSSLASPLLPASPPAPTCAISHTAFTSTPLSRLPQLILFSPRPRAPHTLPGKQASPPSTLHPILLDHRLVAIAPSGRATCVLACADCASAAVSIHRSTPQPRTPHIPRGAAMAGGTGQLGRGRRWRVRPWCVDEGGGVRVSMRCVVLFTRRSRSRRVLSVVVSPLSHACVVCGAGTVRWRTGCLGAGCWLLGTFGGVVVFEVGSAWVVFLLVGFCSMVRVVTVTRFVLGIVMLLFERGCCGGTPELGASRVDVGPRRYIGQCRKMRWVYTDTSLGC